MKRFFPLAICLLLITPFGQHKKPSQTNRLPANAVTKIVVKPEERYQYIEGWGTSLAWWAHALGGWKEDNLNKLLDHLFSPSGLNMNIVRYNIGGGDDPSHHHMRFGADIPGFRPHPNEGHNWNADSRQIRILLKAREKGVNIFEAFSNSPPYWMTYSGCASGNNWGAHNNLRDDMYDDFANYLADVVYFFKKNHQIEFDSVSPINEPISSWWRKGHDQEGCHYERDKHPIIFRELYKALKSRNLNSIVAGPEEWSLDDTTWTYNNYPEDVKKNTRAN